MSTRRCPDCSGVGYFEDDSPEGGFPCTRCDGDGVIPDPEPVNERCRSLTPPANTPEPPTKGRSVAPGGTS